MNFTVFSKENCPYCYKIKTVLELTGKDFTVQTLDEHFTRDEFYDKFGEGSTFPQVVCDDENLEVVLTPFDSSKEIKSSEGNINKHKSHINRGFNLILRGRRNNHST